MKKSKNTSEIPKSVHLINLGCSKNQVDSENILGEMESLNIQVQEDPEQADVVIINTCGFIETAKEESIQEILDAVNSKHKKQKVLVAGCLSGRYAEELRKEIPEVDIWTGTYQKGQIPSLLGFGTKEDFCSRVNPRRRLMDDQVRHAFLKIAEGCNRTCSFCAIPQMRGKQISRRPLEILEEARLLESQGIKEITLIAQDLTFYGREKGGPDANLEDIIRLLLKETNIPWIRLMYAYPAFIHDSLLELMAAEPRICKYLDMPIQHASDDLLKAMQRGYSAASLRKLLLKIRSIVPDIALRTTVLLGFPGEEEKDVQALLDLMEEIRFERLGGFTYSEEEGTSAFATTRAKVPLELAEERLQRIMDRQRLISLEKNQALIGKVIKVIIDDVAEGSEYHFSARTQWDAPEVDNTVWILEGDAEPGKFYNVQILDASEYDLVAKIISSCE